MPLITLQDVSIGFRGPDLLDHANFQIDEGQKIGLLGRNGAGKSTLLKMIAGEVQPDQGDLIRSPNLRVSTLIQSVPQDLRGTIASVVRSGVAAADYLDDETWKLENDVEKILSKMELDPELSFETLSSGMKRRVLLAKSLVSNPDLLLLDEPTNHLDLAAIRWLEEFLGKYRGAFLFVTHDRMFLRKLANRILEIDRGKIYDWSCDYETFLKRKEESLVVEEKQNALFDKRLAEEEVWIRKGIKARRTRNEGRVRALKKMREERSQRRDKIGTSNLKIQEAEKSGQLVVKADEIQFQYGDVTIFKDFSTTIMRSDKVGIIGRNGVGKTTLLKVLLGQLEPTSGKIKRGTNLQIAYFDQLREQLNPASTVEEVVADGADSVVINGAKKHVLGYLQDFLFTPARSRTQIKFLSGGERNRLLLAKLFSKPANLIVLDEPTNDLDSETLDLLEEKLINYSGTVLLVSHDREFLNNVVTSSIVFEKDSVREYDGGYDDWQRQVQQRKESKALTQTGNLSESKEKKAKPKTERPRKLSYKEKRELESLPESIERLETEISKIHDQMSAPDFYKSDGQEIAKIQGTLQSLDLDLAQAYKRWEELESIEGD
ncbi:MAG: ATP-binding cassette domain-containing protein [Planctomycetota bacterium]